MAFQRPFLISLKRQDSNLRWGFGIKGGRDYGEPLMVQTVGEESLAEKFGLHEGDEVIQVGRVNVQDLTLGQVHELLARCGNKIEMFVVREDLLTPRKGKEPQVVRTVVHNPYNSPLSLYSTENIAETLAKQTEVLIEGQVSTEEDEGPENLSFQQKSAVFQLLEEQSKQESPVPVRTTAHSAQVKKPTAAPPPPPKPKPPSNEQIFNGYDHQVYQDQQKTTSRIEYQTTQKVVNQYQQEQPVQYQQQVYQYQTSPGYQSPIRENVQAPVYQSSVSFQGHQSPTPQQPKQNYKQSNQNYQQTKQSYQQQNQNYQQQNQNYQQQNQNYQQPNQNYQHSQGYQSSVNISQQQYPEYQSATTATYQPLNQINYQQSQQARSQGHQTQAQCPQQSNYQQPKTQQPQAAVSKAEIKVGPPPPPRSASTKHHQQDSMAAVYKQQYEQHLQKQYEQQQQMLLNAEEETVHKPKAHIIEEDIFEHNCTSGTPISYKAPPAAPPKPHWPPPPPQHERFRSPQPVSPPNGLRNVGEVWPPKKSNAVDLPRTGFNPAAVREQGGNGRRCVWPPPSDEYRSGRNTPQSPVTGRRIQWNPSPSPPTTRRTTYSSPARRKDVQWPPTSGGNCPYDIQNGGPRSSPRLSRKAKFDDYIHEHASINVPQTYRPPPGTQHIEFR